MNPVATSDAAFRGGACPTPEYTIAYTGNYTTSADANPQQVYDALVTGFCETSPEFFRSSHITMRVDSIDMKAKTKGPVVADCPSGGA